MNKYFLWFAMFLASATTILTGTIFETSYRQSVMAGIMFSAVSLVCYLMYIKTESDANGR